MARAELELTILMPCLNEAETLARCIAKARGFLERTGIAGEVLVADNGSTDGSQAIAEAAGARVVAVAEKGYGAALGGGIAAARGRYVVMGDADDSYDFSRLDGFVAELRRGAALVMGNRFHGGIAPGAMPWHHRYIGNPVLSFLGRLFFRTAASDFHCGLRGFDRAAILGLELRTTGMEFASEMLVKATLTGLRVSEVPTTLVPDGRSRPPHLRSFRDGWRHLRFLLLFSPRWLFLYPGYALLALGLFLGALLFRGPLRISPGIELDIHTFLMAAMFILVGLQSVTFAVIGRRFASQYGFIPRSATFDGVLEALTLERMLAVAAVLVAIGIGALMWGLGQWAERGFGALNPSTTMRAMILAMTTLVAGLQLAMSAFLSSMITVPLQEGRLMPAAAAAPAAAPPPGERLEA
ncbi:glycosyltransferase family 2 protein [Devosia sp.]|uniref:glycosyltransferase family 2 protein n=1 Tax=Devosia sp. TaxID=1871048 RepID=UPI002EE50FA6